MLDLDSIVSSFALFAGIALWSMATRWWMRRIAGMPPAKLDRDSGTIEPDRVTGWTYTILYALLALGCGALLVAIPESAIVSVTGLIIGLVLAGCMFPSVTSLHALNWSSDGVEGTTQMILITLGTKRTSIQWSEIVKVGVSITMYWYLEAGDGRRVYWSFLYVGHNEFTAAIQRHRPDIAIPETPLAV